MAGVWGTLAALIWISAGAQHDWSDVVTWGGGLVIFALVAGGLESLWQKTDERKHRERVEEEERLRVRVRKELSDE